MQREVAQALPIVGRAWRSLADTYLAEFRVSNSMAWCLVYLNRIGPDARQIDLAQAIGITQPTTARALNQLEAGGLIELAKDPDDKRSNRLTLTEEGKIQFEKIEVRLASLRKELFDGIADAEIETTLRVLGILSSRILERRS